MDLLELRDKVGRDLRRQVMSSRILCRCSRLLDEKSRRSVAFCDGSYIPFYYYLGKYLSPVSLFRYGFGLGLFTGAFLQGCHTVERMFAFREAAEGEETSSCKLGGKNLRDVYRGGLEIYAGRLHDEHVRERLAEGWDVVMVESQAGYDDARYLLDVLWRHVAPDGLMVVDRIGEGSAFHDAFRDFCKVQRLEFTEFDTRYGAGVVRKER